MKPFHTIAIPHDDILQGRLTMDVFAADLWDVSKNQGVDEYKDAGIFFKKTYLTQGLKNLLGVVEKRLQGKGGDPIIQIQTPFGGGKTHTLIALYHKAKEWKAKTAVIVGTHLSAEQTLWGLMEEQLTGKVDICKGKISPGSENIKKLLMVTQPVLILIDEILEYATKAAGVKVVDSNLAAQTLAFMQELTEAVSSMERVALVITLPASVMEHYDENSEKLFQQLQRIAGRTEKIYTPVEEDEISKIIRRRLFSNIEIEEARKIVSDFVDYADKENILPGNANPIEYSNRFLDSYPFMPDVIDVLYQRWGSFHDFQRTRGVLRLLSLVIYDLKDESLPYISLADFNLNNQEIRRELLKYIGNEYDSVIASDITGPNAGALVVNNELGKSYRGLKLGSKVAATIFLYSFSGGIEHGVGLNGIKRSATAYPNPSNIVTEAVERLKNKLFYLQIRDNRYYFSNQPNLNRILLTFMDSVDDDILPDIEKELLLDSLKTSIFRVYIWEEESINISDSEDLKLIVLDKKDDKVISDILNNKGHNPRVNKNTLFFVYPSESERVAFNNTLKKMIALKNILNNKDLNLNEDQLKELNEDLRKVQDSLKELIRKLYRLIAVPIKNGYKEKDIGTPVTGVNYNIGQDIFDELKIDGYIVESFSPFAIKEKYLRDNLFVSTGKIYKSSLTTPGEIRFKNREALENSIKEGVLTGIFGAGELIDDKPKCLHFKEDSPVYLSDNEIIIKSEICEEQLKEKQYPKGGGGSGGIIKEPGHPIPPAPPGVEQYSKIKLHFSVPRGKISSIMGLMNFIQSKFEKLDVTLSASEGSITNEEIEDKIKETFMQLGIDNYEVNKE